MLKNLIKKNFENILMKSNQWFVLRGQGSVYRIDVDFTRRRQQLPTTFGVYKTGYFSSKKRKQAYFTSNDTK